MPLQGHFGADTHFKARPGFGDLMGSILYCLCPPPCDVQDYVLSCVNWNLYSARAALCWSPGDAVAAGTRKDFHKEALEQQKCSAMGFTCQLHISTQDNVHQTL